MRIGHNPARFVEKVDQPTEILIGVVNFVPFLSGFYAQSLDVLKACLNSLQVNTPEAHDLLVFDNHSCREVRDYLREAYEQGLIQYLVLSDKNIGKLGAWNFMFGAAQSKYIAFSDSDVLYQKGWLAESLALFKAFPKVGMVTARPYRTLMDYSSKTLEWARQQPAGTLEQGVLLEWDVYWEHARSLGYPLEKGQAEYRSGVDYRLTRAINKAFIGAGHFQFLAAADLLKQALPFASLQPMRGELALDAAVNEQGYLRLSTAQPFVSHMGNTLPGSLPVGEAASRRKSFLRWVLWLPGIRHFLLWLNNRIFRLYFFNVD